MMLLMLMSVTAALAGTDDNAQPETDDGLQIFVKELPALAGDEYAPGEFIVRFKPAVGIHNINTINLEHGASIKRAGEHFMLLNVPEGKTVNEMVKIYSKHPGVEYAEPNYIAHALMVPNDPYYHYQWHLDIPEANENPAWHGDNGGGINIEPAWDISTGTGVVVAVLDTGVAYEDNQNFGQAPDLAGTVFVPGYDYVNTDSHPNDDEGHGTHVTGTIAQTTDNGLGVAGVAFDCSIMPVKVLDSSGSGYHSWIANGIYYAADHDAQVISMSLGGNTTSSTLENALAYAYNKGVTIVCSAGNDGPDGEPSYPAAHNDYCIAVGATRYDETVSDYSTNGDYVDIAAPGGDLSINQNGDIYGDGVLQQTHDGSHYKTFGYWFYEGTSMAAPHVSGVAALLISNGVTDPDDIREALQSTAEDKGTSGLDPEYGWGIVDAYAALQWSPNPPVAHDQSVTTDEDTSVAITLTATDPDGDPLTYSIVSNPSHGTLTGTPPDVDYMPDANHNGADSFTFKANDGTSDSNTATVSITVTPVNDPPIANGQSVETVQGTAVSITLTGSDVDEDTLTFIKVTDPSNGTLTLDPDFSTSGELTYTSDPAFIGEVSFTFKVNDGTVDSDPVTVSITVTEDNTNTGIPINSTACDFGAGNNVYYIRAQEKK